MTQWAVVEAVHDWDGQIALLADEMGFILDGGGDVLAKRSISQQRDQVVVVGAAEGGIVVVPPGDGLLQGAAGVKAGAARVGIDVALGLHGGSSNLRPFGLEETEIGHSLKFFLLHALVHQMKAIRKSFSNGRCPPRNIRPNNGGLFQRLF